MDNLSFVKLWICAVDNKTADDMLIRQALQEMGARLHESRDKGRTGWHYPNVDPADLKQALLSNLERGDYVDVMNLAAMLHIKRILTKVTEGQKT